MAADTKFLGMDSSQIPMFSMFAAFLGVMLTTLAIVIGMFFSMNGDNDALRAEISALRADMNANNNALRADISANDNAIRAEFNIRLDALSAEVADVKIETVKINARLDSIETRLDSVETRLDGVETRLDGVETRLDAVENGLADVDTRLANVERLLPDYNSSRARLDVADRVAPLAAAAPE